MPEPMSMFGLVQRGMSAQLVRLMGGTIQVESEVDKGSTFTITAPFGLAASQASARVDPGVHLLNPSAIRVGAGTRVKPCVVIEPIRYCVSADGASLLVG